jgi:hypothetical protein
MQHSKVRKSANFCISEIKNCRELQKAKLRGFIRGISKGKCPTVLGDSLSFLFEDLEKQICDYYMALDKKGYCPIVRRNLKQKLADLSNVAECMFVKLVSLDQLARQAKEKREPHWPGT